MSPVRMASNSGHGVETAVSMAQKFSAPAPTNWTTWAVSDFQTSQDYYLHEVWSEGRTPHAQHPDGTGANFDIWDGLPWEGGSVVLSAINGYDTLGSAGVTGADFSGALLPAGNYYLVFQAERDFLTASFSLMYQTSTGNNNDWEWNPDLGQGWGSDHRAVQNTTPEFRDVNWQLNATPVPEPSALLLIGLGGLLLRRR